MADERERKSLLRQIVTTSFRQPQTNVANQGRVVAETRNRNAITYNDKRARAHGLIHLLIKTGKMRFAKVQDAMRDGYVVSERGWREASGKGKFPSLARKRQQAHTNRLLHMLTAPENKIMVLNEEATELELMEQTLEVYLEEKSERRFSKKKRREIEGRMQSGGRGEGRKRRRLLVDALVCDEDDCLYLEDYMIPVC
jgi:hypothetical protein